MRYYIIKLNTKNVIRRKRNSMRHTRREHTVDGWRLSTGSEKPIAANECVRACVCFLYYIMCVCACTWCRHLPVRLTPLPTWSSHRVRDLPSYRRCCRRLKSCAFDPSHPRLPSCSYSTQYLYGYSSSFSTRPSHRVSSSRWATRIFLCFTAAVVQPPLTPTTTNNNLSKIHRRRMVTCERHDAYTAILYSQRLNRHRIKHEESYSVAIRI